MFNGLSRQLKSFVDYYTKLYWTFGHLFGKTNEMLQLHELWDSVLKTKIFE